MASHPQPESDFVRRHIGPGEQEQREMLRALDLDSLEALVEETVPKAIRLGRRLALPAALSEERCLAELESMARENEVWRSYLGMGYADCRTPAVILRNVIENPGWYTAYTPYQAEISQGRLEALLNFQTMVIDLTGLPIANASLLDEATAAAEAMGMAFGIADHDATRPFFVSRGAHPQVIEVVRTRARPLGIEVQVGEAAAFDWERRPFGVLLAYPDSDGAIVDPRPTLERARAAGAFTIVATDLLALTLLTPPGEFGADAAIGNSQRFGVPLGYGGPHAAFLATREEHVRRMPGRLIGVSKDAQGRMALRMAIQTREQHIRREKAASNICTAQVLLAVVAGLYAVYHGPDGLTAIARRVHGRAAALARALAALGRRVRTEGFFDTVRVDGSAEEVEGWLGAAASRRINLRRLAPGAVTIALDETVEPQDLADLVACFAGRAAGPDPASFAGEADLLPAGLRRTSPFLSHPVFHRHRSETEMLRYLKRLESRDLSLVHSMIPLGSCTMKLNATTEMIPVTWPGFSRLHPFAPREQARGYRRLFRDLETWLAEITGLAAVSLQPNAGSQGEYTGLLVIRAWHESRGEGRRDVCLIPASAHGTNPASAAMAGLQVVVVRCREDGNIDIADLEARAREHHDRLAGLMVTYPSTYGVFEEGIRRIADIVHEHGGQVYMDGANMNAQVGLTRPGDIGADVCHLNLHKTFCIPHGGGGPGMGPIAVAAHLAPFLPRHPLVETGGERGIGPVSAAPWGSPSILVISWAYIRMMGPEGLERASAVAILNANYVARRLEGEYRTLFRGARGRVAHECILDTRPFKDSAGVEAEDIAKRLMDYGFHAPTMSFPVAGTLMVEPTESESKAELDRFAEAMLAIREEIREIEQGRQPRSGNLLKNAPHTADVVAADEWTRSYPRSRAAWPLAWVRSAKFWPHVGRIDNVWGDRHLACACPPISEYTGEA